MKRGSYYPDSHQDSRDAYQSSGSEDTGTPRNYNQNNLTKSHQKRLRQQNTHGMNGSYTYSNNSRYERFESYAPTSVERDQASKGVRVKFYKNGDPLFKGIVVSVSEKMFPGPFGIESLQRYLNGKIDICNGVRHIFRLRDKKLIREIKELQVEDECVVSSNMTYKKIDYGIQSPLKRGSSLYRNKNSSFRGRSSGNNTGSNNSPIQIKSKPMSFNIINNTMRNFRDIILLNPQTDRTFEEELRNMGETVGMTHNPATALYSSHPPYKKIESFSNLRQELERSNSFLICGQEGSPMEVRKQQEEREMQHQYQQQQQQQQQHYETSREQERDRHLDMHNGYETNQYDQQSRHNEPNGYNQQVNKHAEKPRGRQKYQNPNHTATANTRNINDNPTTTQMNGHNENRQQNHHDRKVRQHQGDKMQKTRASTEKLPKKSQEQPLRRSQDTDRQRNEKSQRESKKDDSKMEKNNPTVDKSSKRYEEDDETESSKRYEEDDETEPSQNNSQMPDRYNNPENGSENDEGEYDDEDDEEDDDEGPLVLRPARKGPRMETPEC